LNLEASAAETRPKELFAGSFGRTAALSAAAIFFCFAGKLRFSEPPDFRNLPELIVSDRIEGRQRSDIVALGVPLDLSRIGNALWK
jgi:hypothetical protein